MDKLKQIEAFVDVIEQGSLTRAALGQNITPVMLGRRIDALEKRLGVKLMHRTTRHLRLTEEGTVFLDHCKKLLHELDSAEKIISEGRHKATGHLVVSAPAAYGRKHVAPHAPGFLAEHPDVRISFNLTDRVVDLVREGYDFGIRFNLQGGQQRGWYFQQNGKPVTLRANGNLDCNDGELLHRWACEGLGLAWRSTWEIQPQLASGELVTVLDDYALPDYNIMAVYPQQRNLPAKVRFFIDKLKAVYAQPGYWMQG